MAALALTGAVIATGALPAYADQTSNFGRYECDRMPRPSVHLASNGDGSWVRYTAAPEVGAEKNTYYRKFKNPGRPVSRDTDIGVVQGARINYSVSIHSTGIYCGR